MSQTATPDFRAMARAAAERATATAAAPTSNRRANRYGGKCTRCGVYVPEGAGYLTGSAGAWGVEHRDGECAEAFAEVPAIAQERVQAAPAAVAIPDATYTVEWQDGSYKTLRVKTQDEFDTFMPGRQILQYLSGSDNTSDYTSYGHLDEHGTARIWKKHQDSDLLREATQVLLGDPKAASKAYAIRSETCSRCHRPLTVPASIHAGMGKDCAEKVGW